MTIIKPGRKLAYGKGMFGAAGNPPSPMNHFYDANIRDDPTTWPNSTKILDKSEWTAPVWLTAPDITEITAEQQVSVGQYCVLSVATPGGSGGGHYFGAGICDRYHNEAGNCVNDTDLPSLYDAIRAIMWVYWDNDNSSDQVFLHMGQALTKGTGWGGLSVRVNRDAPSSSMWGIDCDNGNGSSTYQNSPLNGNTIYCAVQVEFVPGSHLKANFVSAGSVGGYAAPTWPISTGGNYVFIDLSTTYSGIHLISPFVRCASGVDATVGYLSRVALELRATGGEFQYLT